MRWTHNVLDSFGRDHRTDKYHKIPKSGSGTEGENYNATRFGYDTDGREIRTESPGGTINRPVFDTG